MSLSIQEQYDKIYRYCYFKVKNVQLAEDLTQESFLKFFNQNSYINRGKQLAYLYTIAKNLCIDAYKKVDIISLLTDDTVAEENNINTLETNIAVKEAVNNLPQDLQEIILLRYANDLSMTKISRITGLSRFAVYRKITNALNQLKLILREEDFM